MNRILYAGDGRLDGAAAYLAGVLAHAGLPFDHVPSDTPLGPWLERAGPFLYIISDYPVKNLTEADLRRIAADVEEGSGLLMIGGWESFHGAAGEYHRTPLARVLPVHMEASDDRVNCPQPCLLEKRTDHPVLNGLPLHRPPGIGGYNRVRPKDGAQVLLSVRHLAVHVGQGHEVGDPTPDGPLEDGYTLTPGASAPLLAVGRHGRGRTSAFTSDVAPHWVGGLVDWGSERVRARAAGATDIEVGSHYVELFTRLVLWTMGELPTPS